jgi:hypothetical protein
VFFAVRRPPGDDASKGSVLDMQPSEE